MHNSLPAWLLALAACGSSGAGVESWPSPQVTPSSGMAAAEGGAPDAGVGRGGALGSASDAGPSPGQDGAAAAPMAEAASVRAPGDGSTAIDGGSDGAPPLSGDGGLPPYKGVANSACGDLTRLGVTWYYNWTLDPGTCTAAPFVPMVWGHTGNEQSDAGIGSEIDGIVNGGYGVVLGFNEPDNGSQSNMSVATAISLWPSLTAKPSLRVGSPATQANSAGQTWFTNFMNQVNADTSGQLRVDFIAAHWYGWNAGSCDASASSLESYLKWIEAIPGNRPIWLTEWGCLNQSNPTAAVVQTFFSGAVAMFARHPRLERYAWYPWTTNNELVAMSGSLTALGMAFAAAPAHK